MNPNPPIRPGAPRPAAQALSPVRALRACRLERRHA